MSQLAVRNSEAESMSSEKHTTVLSSAPMERKPRRTAVVDAYQRDYEVVVATECIASYDEAHHDITTRYLDGGIAQLLPNREIIKMLAS